MTARIVDADLFVHRTRTNYLPEWPKVGALTVAPVDAETGASVEPAPVVLVA